MALVGHSLGGYTVLGLAGAWSGWGMDGIAAVVALAPFVQPFSRGGKPAGIGVPVLYQVGDKDGLVTPAFEEMGFYAATPAPACRITYRGAGHLAWTDLQSDFHAATAATTAAFLRSVFAGGRPTTAVLNPTPTAPAECK
jgi:pimeloyl-ACP methyl ester carboxylesterase